ncbi:integrase core domain-containing protein [Segatella salivae]|uniref:integrase core domain-containing protein n=1 Tax=Segatella salivae TaxID=228604 RepID=UPI00352FDEA2
MVISQRIPPILKISSYITVTTSAAPPTSPTPRPTLEKAIDKWVKYYNERRFHESLDNLTPRDVYLGQGEKI